MVRNIKTEEEFKYLCEEIRGRKNDINPTIFHFDDETMNNTPIDWDVEYLKIIKKDNNEFVERIRK
tara:strand:+ start:153016 stop:153213 length:198 start_codon:yes stop_codon:yes gene_type:complete